MVMFRKQTLIIYSLIHLVSCTTVGPNYTGVPDIEIPQGWNHKIADKDNQKRTNLEDWWENFQDQKLSSLIESSIENNLDMRIALSRIYQAGAQYGISSAARYPGISVLGSANRAKFSENEKGLPARTENFNSIGVQASWEIDLFGRVRRLVEAAGAEVDASAEGYHDLQVSLVARVARNYIELRTLQHRIDISNKNITAQEKTLKIVKVRFNAELVSEVDVHRAQQNLAASKSTLPILHSALERSMNRLAILVGEPPGTLHQQLIAVKPLPQVPDLLTLNIPRELVRQRPDIRLAERKLAAQSARIGIAEAALYPQFSLMGKFSYSTGLGGGDLLDSASQSWSFGPSFSWNIFNGQRTRRQIALADARTQEARLVYEKTVLGAFEDVENSLIQFSEEKQRLIHLENSVNSAKKASTAIRVQYQSGLTNFQDVLDSERVLLSQEDALAESQGALLRYLINIYRAMGGGWKASGAPILNETMRE